MKKTILKVVTLMLVAILSGCTGKPMSIQLVDSDIPVNFNVEPYESLGLKITDAIKSGDVTVYRGVFPDILRGEYGPGRIRWNGLTMENNGKEFFTQYLLSLPDFTGQMTWTIVVEGNPSESARTMVFSNSVDYAYDAFGREFPLVRKDFSGSLDVREKVLLKNGTPLRDLRKIEFRDFLESIQNWNALTAEKGDILTPTGREGFKVIAQFNPRYADWEKRLSESHVSVFYADPVAIVAYNAIEVFRTESKIKNGGVKSVGWDYASELPNRRAMALTIECFEKIRKALVKKMLLQRSQILTQGD